LFWYLDFF